MLRNFKFITYTLIVIFIITALTTSSFAAAGTAKYTKYGMGLASLHESGIKELPNKLSANLKITSLPTLVDLSSGITIGNQEYQNSCVGWAVASLKSFQESKDHHKSIVASPSYIYNQINFGYDSGAFIGDAFNLLQTKGCATLASMPYSNDNKIDDGSHPEWDNDVRLQPTEAQHKNATQYKASTFYSLQDGNISQIKAWLSQVKEPVVIGIPVAADFYNISPSNKVFDNLDGGIYGYHAVTICGYDDGLQAFKLANSWGTSWGLSGFGYISYNMIQTQGFSSYVCFDEQSPTVVSLSKVTKPTTTLVGKNWSYTVKVGGKVLTTTKPLTTESSTCEITVTEKDKYPDKTTVKCQLKWGTNVVKVTVKENNGRYKGKTATWYFTINRN